MARSIRHSQLENRTSRLKLVPRKKPYSVRVAPGVRLGYRRHKIGGGWNVIAANGKGGNWLKAFAHADDHEEANGDTILNFWQAQERARVLARGDGTAERVAEDSGKPVTVTAALDNYISDLETRGGGTDNVTRVKLHLPRGLAVKAVALLTAGEIKSWRDSLKKKDLKASTVNRIGSALRAALNLAANTDDRIVSRRAWEIGLRAIPDATVSRNVIVPDKAITAIVAEAYRVGHAFGLFVEVAGVTGARPSQIARLEVADVQGDHDNARLMMPSSRKGRGTKTVIRRSVPIPASLYAQLRLAGKDKPGTAPLLTKASGERWAKSDHARLFARAARAAGLDTEVTIYALRHSNIVRQLLANVPIRIVAVHHDTSVMMIEKTYSKYIADHADALTRGALPDFSRLTDANVISLEAAR